MNDLLRPRIWPSFRASSDVGPFDLPFRYASDPIPCGWIPGFETDPDVPMTKTQNLLKPYEYLNFEIVAGFVLRI